MIGPQLFEEFSSTVGCSKYERPQVDVLLLDRCRRAGVGASLVGGHLSHRNFSICCSVEVLFSHSHLVLFRSASLRTAQWLHQMRASLVVQASNYR